MTALAAEPPFSQETVLALIAQKARRAPATIEARHAFAEDLGFDSLDFVQLIMAVEQALGIRLDDKQAAQIRVVSDLLDLLRRAFADGAGRSQAYPSPS
jgi:acyl carrier protein